MPQHKIDEVREATDIVDLVSDYVTLKKKGQNFFGLCPFHNEKTPSFSVHPEKQIFRCFGCGAGGNAFVFLMRHEGVGFPEAVKFLTQRAGIRLEFEERDEAAQQENETLYYVNEFAARYFNDSLLSSKG
ncbi:DNA primase, partial [candidate division KSB1 bacterium]|nr:DNA primase [candidate division KSB1 bacterium]NIR73007.1 DNA primase [candidate division KSB1 bacterium]NIS28281.1 DNA primase [candidate division KSB1 bacterium]NIT75153.1 DNA primase [candidate division KSB1 bacterium]NIU28960.1 DNA primase [candidate division KSB1 bacterium]